MTTSVWWRSFLLLMIGFPAAVYLCLLRVATEAGVPQFGFIFSHTLGSVLLMVPILVLRRTRLPMGGAHLRFYAASAFFGLGIPYVAMTFASPNIPVGLLGMVSTVEPALTYLLALVLLLERFRGLRFFGLLLGIAGLLLILLPQASLPSREMVPWVMVGLAVPVSWAVWSNWIAYARPPEIDSVVAGFGLMLVSAVALLPVAASMGELWWLEGELARLWWIVPVFSVLNIWLWLASFECIRVAGPVFYSVWAFVGTPLTIAAGMIFFGESHSPWIWSALVLLFASLYFVNATMGSARIGASSGRAARDG